MLPGAGGIELMETVPEPADLPVIFISAYGRDETVARALEKGAADYLVKPFSATELTARVQAALRRRAGPDTFVARRSRGPATRSGGSRWAGGRCGSPPPSSSSCACSRRTQGRVSTYESLIRQIWNGPDPGDPDRVRTFVKQLRRKLGDDPARPRYILNERGVGYRVPGLEE